MGREGSNDRQMSAWIRIWLVATLISWTAVGVTGWQLIEHFK